jgi:hypothetical protein
MRRKAFESESGPATLGSTARAHAVLHVWCKDCRHRVDIDTGEPERKFHLSVWLSNFDHMGHQLRVNIRMGGT